MPFMKGRGAVRRTLEYLEKGQIFLRDHVRVITFFYNPGQRYVNEHEGLYNFVFWHLPQIKYKNPSVQLLTFKKLTPTPFIKTYLENDDHILIDCFRKSREEIHEHVKKVLGKPERVLQLEMIEEASRTANPANFGTQFERQCMCLVPGQIACPGWTPLPQEMTGKWKRKMALEGEVD